MQRLTKYSLLLKAVHKNTENEEQRAELTHMVRGGPFANHITITATFL